LHINCTGQADNSLPTVILEAGIGDFSVEWSLVQPGVSKFARVCSYDRAGDGWSNMGPNPRTMHQLIYELHTLLINAGIKLPVVLVGHSYGGVLVRLYAFTYPAEVAGLVLVDAGASDPWRMLADGKLVRSSTLAKDRPVPSIKTSGPLRISDISSNALNQIKAGLPNAVTHANDAPRNKLPADAQQMRTWALGKVGHVAAAYNPFEHEELAELRAFQSRSQHPLGDMPLIVLTRGLPEDTSAEAKSMEDEHRKEQEILSTLSGKGKLIIATRSRHHIQLDEPELVIRSIREMLEAIRRK